MVGEQPPPLDVFADGMADAEALLACALALEGVGKGERDLRGWIGNVLRMPGPEGARPGAENGEVAVSSPVADVAGGKARDPLLRQALLAGCLALETYVVTRALERVGISLMAGEPARYAHLEAREVAIETKGRRWGMRPVLDAYIRETKRTAPERIGFILSCIGIRNWAGAVDEGRGVPPGTTVEELRELSRRRIRIAHAGDRNGRGRAAIEAGEVQRHLQGIRSIVEAIEELLS